MTRLPGKLVSGASDSLVIDKGENVAGDAAILLQLANSRGSGVAIGATREIEANELPLEGIALNAIVCPCV